MSSGNNYLSKHRPIYRLVPAIEEYASSGTFVVPNEVHRVNLLMIAPGGNAIRAGSTLPFLGGGSGGWVETAIDVYPGETLEVQIGDITGIYYQSGGTTFPLVMVGKGGDAVDAYNAGAGAGGFPNGSGGGIRKSSGTEQAGGVAHHSYATGQPLAGGGFDHTSIFGCGMHPGGRYGSGGKTSWPWGAGGDARSNWSSALTGDPGRVIITYLKQEAIVQ